MTLSGHAANRHDLVGAGEHAPFVEGRSRRAEPMDVAGRAVFGPLQDIPEILRGQEVRWEFDITPIGEKRGALAGRQSAGCCWRTLLASAPRISCSKHESTLLRLF